ncbi:hypothetical protein ACVDG3_06625 [Meridianimarinicoccus sp. RP-17]|uniref:hypothetical protein n=1 Tax=Meridianimarinicoccus zhengii TaxID=2056810 RepID=UPI000DAC3DF8|nr:hypothetical protein [Phycocomes zhengii]
MLHVVRAGRLVRGPCFGSLILRRSPCGRCAKIDRCARETAALDDAVESIHAGTPVYVWNRSLRLVRSGGGWQAKRHHDFGG